MINCRKETVKLLCKTFSEESYSNILLDSVLSSAEMTLQDRKFMTTLYYGVLEKKITLDYIISLYSTRKPSKLDKTVLNILRTGIYQIKYMDSVPDNAAVNEAVKLARGFRVSSASGFINAVLRNFIRDGSGYREPSDEKMKLSVRYSVEPDIIKLVSDGYGREFAEAFFERSLEKSPVYVRFNRNAADEEEFFRALGKTEAVRLDILPDCYALSSGNLTGTEAFRKGYFHVQDISSQFACAALNPKENDTVLDLCSAPGGKTFTMAQMMKGTGRVIAFDLHAHRAELIREGAERLGLVKACEKAGMGFIAMKGLAGGLINNSAAAYAYMLQFEHVLPIWGVQRERELDEFLSYQDQEPVLDGELSEVIDRDRKEIQGEFCRGCGYCMPCPAGIEINNCARMSLMIRRAPSAAQLTPEMQEKMKKIEGCLHCGKCKEKCPYGLDTPALLERNYQDYKEILAGKAYD